MYTPHVHSTHVNAYHVDHLNITPEEDSTQDNEEGTNCHKHDEAMLAGVDWAASWYLLL